MCRCWIEAIDCSVPVTAETVLGGNSDSDDHAFRRISAARSFVNEDEWEEKEDEWLEVDIDDDI